MTTFTSSASASSPDVEDEFLEAHRRGQGPLAGLARTYHQDRDHSYCLIGEWADPAAIKAARD